MTESNLSVHRQIASVLHQTLNHHEPLIYLNLLLVIHNRHLAQPQLTAHNEVIVLQYLLTHSLPSQQFLNHYVPIHHLMLRKPLTRQLERLENLITLDIQLQDVLLHQLPSWLHSIHYFENLAYLNAVPKLVHPLVVDDKHLLNDDTFYKPDCRPP